MKMLDRIKVILKAVLKRISKPFRRRKLFPFETCSRYNYSYDVLKANANATLKDLLEIDEEVLIMNSANALENNNSTKITYKQRKSFDVRKQEVDGIKQKFPNKVPVIVERYHKEVNLPALDKVKFLVPQELTMSQFCSIIRNRMLISNTQSIYLIANNRSVTSMSKTVLEVYHENKDRDGFLYVTYASQAMFGRLKMYGWL